MTLEEANEVAKAPPNPNVIYNSTMAYAKVVASLAVLAHEVRRLTEEKVNEPN